MEYMHTQAQDFSGAAKRAGAAGVSYMIGNMPKSMLAGRKSVQSSFPNGCHGLAFRLL